MELLVSLPADLAVMADPSAREAAPLLLSRDSGGNGLPAVLPFAEYLELLAEPPLGGELWPADGKDLPLALPEIGAPVPELQPSVFLQSLPAVPVDTVISVAVPLTPGRDPGEALPSPVLPPPEARSPALPPSMATNPGQTPLPAGAAATLAPILESLAADEPTAEPTSAPAPRGAEAPAGPSAERSWLEAFLTHDARARAPQPVAAVADPRTPAQAATQAAAHAATTSEELSPSTDWPARAAAVPQAPQGAMRRLDEFRLAVTPSTVAETQSAGQAGWPPAGASTGATSTTAAPATPSPSMPVDVRTPHWQEAFASRVQVLVETQAGEARIKLNPPELGAVDVKISLVDDKTYVQLTAATAAARDELAQSLPRLRELLTVGGLEVGGTSVHNGRDQHPGRDGYGAAAADSRAVATAVEGGAAAETFLPRRALGRIDIFA